VIFIRERKRFLSEADSEYPGSSEKEKGLRRTDFSKLSGQIRRTFEIEEKWEGVGGHEEEFAPKSVREVLGKKNRGLVALVQGGRSVQKDPTSRHGSKAIEEFLGECLLEEKRVYLND